mmetsp:Transcript_2704/g.10338  ORF Transcript_2704/g.10338 Transcript_2704/m.10338 type:complete len:352 (-) Transcript_2704:317-1372(-)
MATRGVLVVATLGVVASVCSAASRPQTLPEGGETPFEYDPARAARALALTELSYCIKDKRENYLSDAHVEAVVTQATSGGRAVVGFDATDATVFVAYRGSSNTRNWIENAKIVKTTPFGKDGPYADVAVERGFWDWYRDLNASGVFESVVKTSAQYGVKDVKVVGHSAGGACATLFAFDFSALRSFPDDLSLVSSTTFGSPRVGDSNFADAYTLAMSPQRENAVTTRVTHARDVVPHLPQERLLHFRHVSREVFYDEPNAHYDVCDGSGEDPECSNACAPLGCTSVNDHMDYLNVSLGVAGCPAARVRGAAEARGESAEEAASHVESPRIDYPDIPVDVLLRWTDEPAATS